ncbi:hypothetical protein GE09DRAFT_1220097 [Coniochaeta sp. 2T2.1]|nr:hypothetical protein GE09DRAFT_1220097 [Coniochaeta sp. 2T2.1]
MTSVDVELISPALPPSSSYISRVSSAPSVLVTGSPEQQDVESGDKADGPFQDVELAGNLAGVDTDGVATLSKLDGMCVVELQNAYNSTSAADGRPFHRWMKTLHRRAVHRRIIEPNNTASFPDFAPITGHDFRLGRASHTRGSSSGSSSVFITGMKTASVSLAGTSFFARSRRNTARSSRGHSRADRSSAASIAHPRLSTDSTWAERPIVMDQAVTERSLQRRRILEELITTEESYIGDVRFLMNVYITILASLPSLAPGLRSSINQNLTEIIQLHEELLGDLHRAVPRSEYTQLDSPAEIPKLEKGSHGHRRWKSLDAVLEDKASFTVLQSIPGMTTEPQVAADVAKVFLKKMNRFFIYEEYGAKYELMIKDVASAHRTMPRWESYQKGLETLAAALGTGSSQSDLKKSLTIGDLLVKPIQRVCRYPLLFAELLKYTPVCDCPHSHMEIEATLVRMREATAEINRATDDSRIKATLEKTWILQDRLVFPNQNIDAACKNQIRSLGHIQLCGALHICWQTKEGVDGQYMVSLLYRDWLCLAVASRADQIYSVQACINITTAKVEDVDNGRGIQCHTAPYSWKLVFLCDHQLYEIIMTACTVREEQEWRSRLSHSSGRDTQTVTQSMFDSLALPIKALGTVFGKQGTIARRISVHRATTVGPKTPLCQVILKNTSVVRDATPSSSASSSSHDSSSTSINRSMSLLATAANNRIPVLAPPRGERARLEAMLQDVWTRDVLPFPGITARSRSEYLVKASASNMMRKLSAVGRRSHSSTTTTTTTGSRFRLGDCTDDSSNTATRRSESCAPTGGSEATQQYGRLSSIPDDEWGYCYPQVESEWGADVLRSVGQVLLAGSETKRARDENETMTETTTTAATATETERGGGRPLSTPAAGGTGRNKRVKRSLTVLKKAKSSGEVMCITPEKENLDALCVADPERKFGGWRKVGIRGLTSLFH